MMRHKNNRQEEPGWWGLLPMKWTPKEIQNESQWIKKESSFIHNNDDDNQWSTLESFLSLKYYKRNWRKVVCWWSPWCIDSEKGQGFGFFELERKCPIAGLHKCSPNIDLHKMMEDEYSISYIVWPLVRFPQNGYSVVSMWNPHTFSIIRRLTY